MYPVLVHRSVWDDLPDPRDPRNPHSLEQRVIKTLVDERRLTNVLNCVVRQENG
jgi:hypothetical protein